MRKRRWSSVSLAASIRQKLLPSNYQRLAQMLVARAKASMLGSSVRVCDPFCGDGRLIAALLSQVAMHKILSSRRWIVTLQDIERAAVAGAHTLVTATASDLGLDFEVRCVVADSFGIAIPSPHDAVVTNPPWELLKPDSRELGHLTPEEETRHRKRLRHMCQALDNRFPEARSGKAWGGWGKIWRGVDGN